MCHLSVRISSFYVKCKFGIIGITDLIRFVEELKKMKKGTCLPILYESLVKIQNFKNYTICNYQQDDEDLHDRLWAIKSNCSLPCTTLSYTGQSNDAVDYEFNERHVGIGFFLSKDREVQEEYLITDVTGFIGYAGGTLGLFVGFSFYDVIKYLSELKNVIYYHKH